MATTARLTRQKISTTISPDSAAYLDDLIRQGKARSMAEAFDLAVAQLRMYENRERLARDTAAYFDNSTPEQAEEELHLGAALASSVKGIDFDREP
jgi:hypothetical protein